MTTHLFFQPFLTALFQATGRMPTDKTKYISTTINQGLVSPSRQGVGGEAPHAANGTGQPVGGQVSRPMLKSSRSTKLPELEREGSVAEMKNYGLEMKNLNEKPSKTVLL